MNKGNTPTVMAIGAHPDDVEVGAGGALSQFAESGYRTVIVDLTNGEPTPHGTPEIRAEETAVASEILKVDARELLDLPNRELLDTIEARKKLATVMRKHRPDILLAQYNLDAHPDHIASSSITTGGRFYSKLTKSDIAGEPFYPGKIFYYFAFHLQAKIEPSFIFDITDRFESKLAAIKAYKSQFITNKKNVAVVDAIETEAKYWGKMAGCRYGEPYYCNEHLRISDATSFFRL